MKKILIPIFTVAIIFSSCQKFLDIKPKDQKPIDEDLSTLVGVQEVLYNAYDRLQSNDVFGQDFFKINALMSDEINLNLIPGSSHDIDFITRAFDKFFNPATNFWNTAYRAIYNCNLVIQSVDNNTFEADQPTKDELKGEALFIRGLLHFELVRMFALPYSNNPSVDPGIMVRNKAYTPVDATALTGRNTVQESYDQAISDLKGSISLLPASNNGRATSWAAKAYLARVYFNMNDFTNAQTYSDDLISNSGISIGDPNDPNSVVAPFDNTGNVALKGGVIFAIINITGDDNSAVRNLFWSTSATGAAYKLNAEGTDNVYEFMQANGGRRYDSLIIPIGGAVSDPYCRKYRGPSSSGTDPVDIPILRMAEMYLDRAECRENNGDETGALADLNLIRQIAGLPPVTSGSDVLTALHNERRAELLLEGDRWNDLRRLKMDCRGFAYNSTCLVLIPPSETNSNPDIVQNVCQ